MAWLRWMSSLTVGLWMTSPAPLFAAEDNTPTGASPAGPPGPTPAGAAAAAGGDPAPPGPPDPSTAGPGPAPDDDDDEPEPPLIPPALDTVGGHLTLGVGATWVIPFANVEGGLPQGDVMGSGPGLSFDAGYGISRAVALGVWGQAAFLGEGDECRDCKTTSYAFGGFIRYHLAQGLRFDPWMSAGLGYRLTTVDTPNAGKIDYAGIEWLRLQVGGDWYAFDKLGFGPFVELDLGRYTSKSPGDLDESANHWQFSVGARVVFDLPGK